MTINEIIKRQIESTNNIHIVIHLDHIIDYPNISIKIQEYENDFIVCFYSDNDRVGMLSPNEIPIIWAWLKDNGQREQAYFDFINNRTQQMIKIGKKLYDNH